MQVDNVDEAVHKPRSPTPQAALPSFPRPIVPDAPSKSTLALQGVDKALLQAEFIDPAHVLPLAELTKSDGGIPVLSERMKKRLVELGIVELFAGALIQLLEGNIFLSTSIFSADRAFTFLAPS